jgi:hypothetical protein
MIGSILSALPTYTMQTCYISRLVCDMTGNKYTDFIWGDDQNHCKMHMVAWEDLCIPKEFGELGLRLTRLINDVSLMKLGWNLMIKRDSLWVQVLL